MRLRQIFFVFAFCMSACGNPDNLLVSSDSVNVKTESDSGYDFVTTDTSPVSTDYIFDLKMKLPSGYFFDTIEISDSALDLHYMAYIVQSSEPRMVNFNSTIRNTVVGLIENDRAWFQKNEIELTPTHEMTGQMNYSWELGPFEMNIVDQMLSLCCIIDTYSWGGNHHNYRWLTFNYDFKKDHAVSFQQVFELSTKQDSIEFQDLIHRHQPDPISCTDWHVGIDSVDFLFVRRGICFNPDLSWACGMQRAFVPFDSIKPYLSTDYEDVK